MSLCFRMSLTTLPHTVHIFAWAWKRVHEECHKILKNRNVLPDGPFLGGILRQPLREISTDNLDTELSEKKEKMRKALRNRHQQTGGSTHWILLNCVHLNDVLHKTRISVIYMCFIPAIWMRAFDSFMVLVPPNFNHRRGQNGSDYSMNFNSI